MKKVINIIKKILDFVVFGSVFTSIMVIVTCHIYNLSIETYVIQSLLKISYTVSWTVILSSLLLLAIVSVIIKVRRYVSPSVCYVAGASEIQLHFATKRSYNLYSKELKDNGFMDGGVTYFEKDKMIAIHCENPEKALNVFISMKEYFDEKE